MNVSEFVYHSVMSAMELEKLNSSQSQFIELFEIAFKKVFEPYFKQDVMLLNKIEFNTKWLLKQQDIFMQHLKIPQTKEELIVSIIPHPITEKAQEIVLKDVRKMASRKKELEDE